MNVYSSRTKSVVFALIVFTIIKLLLASSKIGLGYWYGSVAVMGDGVHDLTDVGSSVMIGLSVYLMTKPANRSHPFGRARIEYVAASVIGVIILYAGISVLTEAVGRIFQPRDLVVEPVLLAVLVISLLVQTGLMFFFRYMKTKISSEMVNALGADAYSDLLMTVTVLVSICVEYFSGWKIDAFVGTAVSFALIGTGLKVLYDGLDKLLGKRVSENEEQAILTHIRSYEGVLGVHDLIVHDYGPGYRFISCHVEVDSRDDLVSAHRLIDKIERSLREKFLVQAVIHVDPRNVADPEVSIVENEIRRLVAEINPRWNVHDFYGTRMNGAWDLNFEVSVGEDTRPDEEIYYAIRDAVKAKCSDCKLAICIDRHYIMSKLWRED